MSAGTPDRRATATVGRRRRSHPGRRDGGAAAVEFALVAPLLFVILFGIISYGVWFADSIALRTGAREAARAGAVARFDAGCNDGSLPGASAELSQLACVLKQQTPTMAGPVAVSIQVRTPAGDPTDTWTFGNTLRVCAQQRQAPILPLIPLPDGGIVRTRVDMSVEAVPGGGTSSTTMAGGEDAPPAGSDWAWC